MVETAHRKMCFIRKGHRKGRQGAIVLDGGGEFENALAGIVQPDGENRGIHQDVDILVDGMDDILDRQRRGDIPADPAELLHILLLGIDLIERRF